MSFEIFDSFHDAEDVVLAQDEVLFAVDLHFGPAVLAEEDPVAGLDLGLLELAVDELAVADRNDLALDRLFLGGVRDDDPALGLFFFFDALDEDAVLQRTDGHLRFSFRNLWVSSLVST